jgi:hypothetical protein
MKKQIRWNSEKARQLSNDAARGSISFEDCVIAIEDGRVLDDIPNPNYSNQRMLILNIDNYVYVVPYITEEKGFFLKTVFPSRKHTEIYLPNLR